MMPLARVTSSQSLAVACFFHCRRDVAVTVACCLLPLLAVVAPLLAVTVAPLLAVTVVNTCVCVAVRLRSTTRNSTNA